MSKFLTASGQLPRAQKNLSYSFPTYQMSCRLQQGRRQCQISPEPHGRRVVTVATLAAWRSQSLIKWWEFGIPKTKAGGPFSCLRPASGRHLFQECNRGSSALPSCHAPLSIEPVASDRALPLVQRDASLSFWQTLSRDCIP